MGRRALVAVRALLPRVLTPGAISVSCGADARNESVIRGAGLCSEQALGRAEIATIILFSYSVTVASSCSGEFAGFGPRYRREI